MKAANLTQATRIAEAGARKMTREGYTFKLFPMSRVAGAVIKADGTTYKVNTYTGTCSCPFRAENPTCKHVVWLKDELAWQADAERRAAEWEAEQQDRCALSAF